MKKLFIPLVLGTLSIPALSAPINPMQDYNPSVVPERNVHSMFRSLNANVKGDDCYRRAHIWAHQMYTRNRVKSTKLFIHYTNRWNRELDNMGGEFYGWKGKIKKKTFDVDGRISDRDRGMVRSNIAWDYHVAPMVITENGQELVLDRWLDLAYDAQYPYTDREAWNLVNRVATAEEWSEALTIRGEILWKARKAFIEKKIRKHTRKENFSKVRAYQKQLRELGMADKNSIDIKCERVESIAEVDKNHATAWCFTTVAPMYYYNEVDLRYLAYGNNLRRYNRPPPLSVHTDDVYQDGERYIQRQFNESELKDAKKEFKR